MLHYLTHTPSKRPLKRDFSGRKVTDFFSFSYNMNIKHFRCSALYFQQKQQMQCTADKKVDDKTKDFKLGLCCRLFETVAKFLFFIFYSTFPPCCQAIFCFRWKMMIPNRFVVFLLPIPCKATFLQVSIQLSDHKQKYGLDVEGMGKVKQKYSE